MHERIHGSRTEKAIMASCALMCVILICAFVTNGADAEQEQDAVTLDHLEYTLNADGTAELTDYDYETYIGDNLVIPTSIEVDGTRYTVTSIGENALKNCTMTSLVIQDSVTDIGKWAFQNCNRLEYAYIGSGVEKLPPHAFYSCESLTEIGGMDNLKEIGDGAFVNTGLKTFTVPDGVTTVEESAFGSSLDTLTLGPGTRTYHTESTGTFHPFIIVSEENPAFVAVDGVLYDEGMTTLISFPAQYRDDAFIVPETVEYISDNAFTFANISGIDLNNISAIGNGSFSDCALESVDFTSSLITIGNEAFNNCTRLESVTFGSGVETIGDGAFANCTSLLSISFPDSVTSLGESVLSDCTSLTAVHFGNGIASIPKETCDSCDSLVTVTGLKGKSSIGDFAFQSTGLESLTIPDSVTSVGMHVVSSPLSTLWIGSGLTTIEENTFSDHPLDSIGVSEDNPSFTSVDGALYDKDMTTLYIPPSGLAHFTVPDGVTTIAKSAFNRYDITSVELPEGLERIEDRAFLWCDGLSHVDLPESLTHIGVAAFGKCMSLHSISIPESVAFIGDAAFEWSGLERVRYACVDAEVGEGAFEIWDLTIYTDGPELPSYALGDAGNAVYRPLAEYSEPTQDDGPDVMILATVAITIVIVALVIWALLRRSGNSSEP